MKTTTEQPSCKWNLQWLFILICTTLVSTFSYGQAGNAPMQQLPPFPGPFAIDGFLQRQGVNGDWLGATDAGINRVFTDAGQPAPGILFSFLKRDLFDDQTNDEIFDGGNKLNQNPNVWGWRSQKPPAKDDINNAAGWVAINPVDNHIWLAISGDRMSTNGTSYIDFEFYQNEITRTGGPIPGGTGGFSSSGPHNGRTVGDLSLTLEFTAGGSLATIKYLQWQPGAEAGSYDYFPLNPPAGTAFAAANAGEINVPYGAFGATTYAALQWAEGAVDLTALIGGTGAPGECGTQPFESLFIKTKSSASSTADLKDFIAPFSLNTCFDQTPPVITCPPPIVLGCNPTIPGPDFTGGSATDNCNGTIIPVAADGPVTSSGCNRSMTRIWRATDACGNAATCGQLITWTSDNTAPVITTGGTTNTLGCNPVASDINAALGTASATDNCGSATLSSPSDGTVSSDGCSRSQTRTWSAVDACSGLTTTASRTVTWTSDVTAPSITCPGTLALGCNAAIPDPNTGSVTVSDACPGSVTVVHVSTTLQSTVACLETRLRIYRATDACGNTATCGQTITRIVDVTPPGFTGSYTTVELGCNPAASDISAALGNATATDGCGTPTVLAPPSDGAVQSTTCGRSQTRTFTARDACGNTATISRTVTWTSSPAAPTFTGSYATVPLGCNPVASDILAALGGATATSACATITPNPSDGPVVSTGCGRSQIRTFTASDGCGNTATASRTVTWTVDVAPPVITTGGTVANGANLGCNPTPGAIDGALGTATATDACGNPTLSAPVDGSVSSQGCSRSQTRTFRATDACGNTSTASRTISWIVDLTPPVITTGGTVGNGANLGCNPTPGAIDGALGTATATDACGNPTLSAPVDGSVSSEGCSRSQTRTFRATDACGNTSTASRTISWIVDLTPPVITTGGTVGNGANLGCNPTPGAIDGALGTATATDACGNPTLSAPVDGSVSSEGCSRSQTRTFRATDACGNTSTASRTISWIVDLTPPVITTGGTVGNGANLGCNPTPGAIDGALGTATATDACGNPTLSAPVDGSVSSQGCSRSQTRTFRATDACGNTSTASRTISWIVDLTPPVITTGGTVGNGANLGCNPTPGAIDGALGTATATDACGNPTLSAPVDGSVSSEGCSRSQTRTFRATDACGNTSTASRTISWIVDLTPPVITTGGTVGNGANLGCNPTPGAIDGALGTATATDACGNPTLSAPVDGSVSSEGCSRSQTRTFRATDACGNTSTASRTISWIVDLTPPVITTGGTVANGANLGCNPTPGAIDGALGTATATDACGNPTLSAPVDGSVSSEGCSRSQTRTFRATDACGNTATASRTISWIVDLTPPVITTGGTVGNGANLGCNPTPGAIDGALGTATATDACGNPTLSAPVDGSVSSQGCSRSQTRTFRATDACGNTSTASRTISWIVDLTPPVITTGGTVGNGANLGCNPTPGAIDGALGTATATDACGNPTLSAPVDGSVSSQGCARSQTRTFRATDACGNTSTASRTISWIVDLTPPVITTGGTVGNGANLGCNPTPGAIDGALGTATATDACGNPTLSAPVDGSVSSEGCSRSQTRTFRATDACGNTSTASRTISWIVDLTPPVITTGGTSTSLGCNPSASDINGALGTATATDACGNPTLSAPVDGSVSSQGCSRSQTRTFRATDACGNTSTASRTISWIVDLTPPVITTGGTVGNGANLGCNPTPGAIDGALGTATATDACGNPTLSAPVDGSVSSQGCSRSQTRTFRATDACGNTSTASRTISWIVDLTPPVITTGGTSTSLGCNPSASDINGALGTATATDACGNPTLSAPVDGSVSSQGCSRSQTRTFRAIDACGNTSTASRTATWTSDVTPPTFVGAPASVDIECFEQIPAVVNPTATDACGSATVTSTGTTDNTLQCTLTNAFKRIVTRSWKATDACGNTATYTQTIRVKCCEAICTYTQGAYGNAGGQDCDGDNSMSTTLLINQSIANWSGNLTIGKPGKSVVIGTGDAACVIAALPGGGPAKELPNGNFDICALPNSITGGNGGRIKNVLLAQTITLGLNIGITSPSDLGVFPLQAGVLATTDPVGGCGSDIPEERVCHYNTASPYNLISVENEYTYRTISAAVVNAIPGTKNVSGLLELANRALANTDGVVGSENGVSLTAIADAAAAINEVFDECKIFVGWNVAPCPATDPTPGDGRVAAPTSAPALAVTAFPNPYEENFSLKINSPVSGQAAISFYTMDGVKIGEMKRDVVEKKDVWVPYNVPAVYRTRIVYTVTVGSYNAKGIVLSPN